MFLTSPRVYRLGRRRERGLDSRTVRWARGAYFEINSTTAALNFFDYKFCDSFNLEPFACNMRLYPCICTMIETLSR